MPAHVWYLTPCLAAVAAALCLAAGCDLITPGEEANSLSFEPGQLDLQAVEGSADPADELVTLHHDGAGTISWSATCDQPWGTVTPPSGSMGPMTTMAVRVAADPQGLTAGTYSATVTATSGGNSAVIVVEFTVTPATGPPTVTGQPSDVTVTAGGDATFSIMAAGSAPITYQWRQGGMDIPGATSASLTVYSVTVGLDSALYSCVVSNAYGSETSTAATLTVNMAPPGVTADPANQTVAEGQTATFSVTATGSGTLTYQWKKDGTEISGATSADYTTPVTTLADSGAQFTCVVSNAAGSVESSAATLTVTTTPNNAPTAVDDTATVDEDSADNTIDVLANDSDPDVTDTLTVQSVTVGSNGTSAVSGGSLSVTYTPDADFAGSDSFTYTVSDGNGGTDNATVNVTVTSVNDPPDAVDDSPSAVLEDSTDNVFLVLVNDTFAPDAGETLTITGVTQGTNGSVAFTATQVAYTPDPDYYGSDSFTYLIDDGNGGTDTATVTVTVTNVNDAPVAADDAASVDEDSIGNVIDVLANDTYLPDPVEPLTITAVTDPSNGSATHDGSQVTYGPDPGYSGPDSFTYTISDGSGGTATGTVGVSITPDTTPPTPIGDFAVSYSGVVDTVMLTWTATGDDGPVGTADSYMVKMSASPITDANFDSAMTSDQFWTPLASGQPESHDVTLPWYVADWYFAIKAVDSSANQSPMSNVIVIDTNPAASLPSAFDYGDVLFNNVSTRSFDVACSAASLVDLVVSGIQITGDAAYSITAGGYVSDITLAPGESHSITVECLTTGAGAVAADLDITQNSTGAAAVYPVALTANGINEAPWTIWTNVTPNPVQNGTSITIRIDAVDNNNDLPGIDDIAQVTIDATAIGGGAADLVPFKNLMNPKSATYETTYTVSAAAGSHALPVTVTDVGGLQGTDTVAVTVYTGVIYYVADSRPDDSGDGLTWPTAKKSIQAGLDLAAASGDMVMVADGTYTGMSNKMLQTNGKAVILTSENGAATTIIDCENLMRAFVMINTAETNATVISGFTVKNASLSAVWLETSASPTFQDCVFETNTNTNDNVGGAFHLDASGVSPVIRDCTFTGNTVTLDGAAIYAFNGASVALSGCTFDGNIATADGGGIYFGTTGVVGDLTVSDSTFTSNSGSSGGAIYASYGNTFNIVNCDFSGNYGYYGVVRVGSGIGAGHTIDSCTFDSNTGSRGVLYLDEPGTVTNCDFNLNVTTYQGGATYVNATVNFSNCDFVWNSADVGTGAYVYGGSPTFTDCLFDSNIATESSGPGAYVYGGTATFTRCTFTNNTAGPGGAGGAVAQSSSSTMNLVDCLIDSNHADGADGYGGALWIRSTATVTNCIMTNNTAAKHGGAIWCQSYPTITNCLIAGNTAGEGGGGIHFNATSGTSTMKINNCTITDNVAQGATQGGGGICVLDGLMVVTDTIIWGNSDAGALGAHQLYLDPAYSLASDPFAITYSDINSGEIVNTGLRMLPNGWFQGGLIFSVSADPLFATVPEGDYFLSQTAAGQGADSPCVDVGSDTAVNLGLDTRTTRTDLTVDGGQVDMGYHYAP